MPMAAAALAVIWSCTKQLSQRPCLLSSGLSRRGTQGEGSLQPASTGATTSSCESRVERGTWLHRASWVQKEGQQRPPPGAVVGVLKVAGGKAQHRAWPTGDAPCVATVTAQVEMKVRPTDKVWNSTAVHNSEERDGKHSWKTKAPTGRPEGLHTGWSLLLWVLRDPHILISQ